MICFGLWVLAGLLGVLRRGMESHPRLLYITQKQWVQPLLQWTCRMKAIRVHRHAAKHCPAYRDFLAEQGENAITRWSAFSSLPITTKENYVKRYPIEARCYGGRLPKKGVVIDESSGSSGTPNNWVRGQAELASVRTLIQHAFRQNYGDKQLIVLNCFALGAWATGMNVTMSLADIAIIKSIGPDKQRLDNTLKQFGPGYSYLIAGYPPFLKNYADTTAIDLAPYDAHLVLGGEGISEGLRDHLLKTFTSVRSSFGASDLEINIGVETDLTIALRRRCLADPELSQALFGRPKPPMLFQYSPADYHIESSEDGELIFTIARLANIAPKVRYNLHDEGGAISYRQLKSALASRGIDARTLQGADCALPLLYVFGRSDMTVAFYGANLYPSDLEAVLHDNPQWVDAFNSFQLRVEERGPSLQPTLIITLEHCESGSAIPPQTRGFKDRLIDSLIQVNQDFREVSKLFDREQVIIERCDFGTGCFESRDIRIKSQYLGS